MSLKKVMSENDDNLRHERLYLYLRGMFIVGTIMSIITIILTMVLKVGAYRILKIKAPFFQVLVIIYFIVSLILLISFFLMGKFKEESEKKVYIFTYIYDLYNFFMKTVCIIFVIMTYTFSFVNVVGDSMKKNYHSGDILIIRTLFYSPKRDDVAIVYSPDLNDLLIKRIIALPGDNIEYDDGVIYVNSKATIETTIWAYSTTNFTLEKGKYFIVGDNYSNSLDSRFFGPVDGDDIIGKVFFRVWPFTSIGKTK